MGRPDVDAMLAELPAPLLLEWMAYARLEPWDEYRADLRSGQIVAAIANLFRAKGKPARKASEFAIVQPVGQKSRGKVSDPALIEAMFKGMAKAGVGQWQSAT